MWHHLTVKEKHFFMAKSLFPIATVKPSIAPNVAKIEQALANIANTAGQVLEDGKLQAGEYLQLFGHFQDVSVILSLYPAAAKEVKGMSHEERSQAIQDFAALVNLPGELAEKRFDSVFIGGGMIYSGLAKAYSGVKLVVEAWKKPTAPAPAPAETDPVPEKKK